MELTHTQKKAITSKEKTSTAFSFFFLSHSYIFYGGK